MVLLNAWAKRLNYLKKHDTLAPTTIVIDRPDTLKALVGDGTPVWPICDRLLDLTRGMLEVLDEAHGVVKVIVTMHANFREFLRRTHGNGSN